MSAAAKLNLRPFERRLVVGIGVILFLVLNLVFVWPHFKDWRETREKLEAAHATIAKYRAEIAQAPEYEKKVKVYEDEGAAVVAEDQANQFLRTVQNQAAVSGVTITSISRQSTRTNEFFLEQLQTFQVQAREEQLVDFLFNLGSGESIIGQQGGLFQMKAGSTIESLSGKLTLHSRNNEGGMINAAAGAVVDVTGGDSAVWTGTYTGSGAGRDD